MNAATDGGADGPHVEGIGAVVSGAVEVVVVVGVVGGKSAQGGTTRCKEGGRTQVLLRRDYYQPRIRVEEEHKRRMRYRFLDLPYLNCPSLSSTERIHESGFISGATTSESSTSLNACGLLLLLCIWKKTLPSGCRCTNCAMVWEPGLILFLQLRKSLVRMIIGRLSRICCS
jgi:hypothetical protein